MLSIIALNAIIYQIFALYTNIDLVDHLHINKK